MVLECELKYLEVDLEKVSATLAGAGAERLGRYFESNIVFDRPDRSLKEADTLLRLRQKKGTSVLTVKKPPQEKVDSALKVFEEIETEVKDFDAMQNALEAIGFVPTFAYEKVREKWYHLGCAICLDLLPFGDFVEIEGSEDDVLKCAGMLGLEGYQTSKETYYNLNLAYRRQKGLDEDESFVFDVAVKRDLMDQFAED